MINISKTDGHKVNMSKSRLGMKFTDEHKRKLSREIIDILTGKVFFSIVEAAEYIGIKRTTLNAKLSGQNKNNTNLRYRYG